MSNQTISPPERIVSSVADYYQEVQFAANVLDSGINDLIVLIYGEKIRLKNAASICEEPPMIQKAVCEIARIYNEKISLEATARKVKDTWSSQEWNTKVPFAIDPSKLKSHLIDMEKAAKIKERANPGVLVALDQGWVTMSEAVILSSEQSVVQEIACKVMWNGNTGTRRSNLNDALAKTKAILSTVDD